MHRLQPFVATVLFLLIVAGTSIPLLAAPQAPDAGTVANTPLKPSPEVQALLDAGHKSRQANPPRLDEAEQYYTQALGEARKRGDTIGESRALLNLGNVYSTRQQRPKALDYYQQAQAISHLVGDKSGQGDALLNIAILFAKTRTGDAIDPSRQAALLFHEAGNIKREVEASIVLGNLLMVSGQIAQSKETYNRAISLAESIGYEKAEADVWFYLGSMVSFEKDQTSAERPTTTQAKEYYQKALLLYHKLKDPFDEAWTATLIGGVWFYEGHIDEARQGYEQALALYRTLDDKANMADTLKQLSNLNTLQERLLEALQYDQEALDIYRKMGNKTGEGMVLLHIGDTYTRFGQQRTALQSYLQALPLFEQVGNIDDAITTLHGIGEIYDILGDHKTALTYLQKVIPLLEKPTSALYRQRNLGVLAGIYFETHQLVKAQAVLEQQIADKENAAYNVGLPSTLGELALVERNLGQPEKALEHYRQELQLIDTSNNGIVKAQTLVSIAEIEEDKGDLTDAEQHLRASVAILEKIRTSLSGLSEAKSTFLSAHVSTYQEYLALLLRLHKPDEAFALAQKMKARALLDILYDGKVQIAGSLTPEEREAEKLLRQKADTLNYRLVKEGVQNEIGSKKRAEALKVEIADTERELQIFEDRLYLRHPDLAQKRAATTVTLADVAKFLPEDTALLEYVTLRFGKIDRTLLFVVTQRAGKPSLWVQSLALGQKALESQVDALRNACRDPRKAYRPAAKALYRTLIGPAEGQLTGKKRLLICPDGALWDTPFAALVSAGGKSAKRERFLMERYEIAYAYSATGAQAALSVRSGGRRRLPTKTALVFADPRFGDEERFGDDPQLPGQRPISAPSRPIPSSSRPIPSPSRPLSAPSRPIAAPSRPIAAPSRSISAPSRDLFLPRGGYLAELPGTRLEARAIRADFKDAAVFTREAAQEATAKREAGPYRYLHFATHGFFNDAAPLLSAIVLALPDKASGEDGFLTAREIFGLDLSADMVVLSACNTARGEKRTGEGLIGLTWALFAAGTPTQVVSQWSVNDASTALLMQRFYANLTHGHMARGAALRQAALSLLPGGKMTVRERTGNGSHFAREGGRNYGHPYYWAPFILIGNWQK